MHPSGHASPDCLFGRGIILSTMAPTSDENDFALHIEPDRNRSESRMGVHLRWTEHASVVDSGSVGCAPLRFERFAKAKGKSGMLD